LIPKASGDPGVSRSTTIVLVVLAASHGLLVAIGATSLWRKIDSFSAQSAAPVVTQKPVVKPTPPAPPAPIKEPEFESHDGANKPAPTCDALLADTRPQRGNMLGAAVEQGQIANKALVRGNLDEAQRAFCKAVRWDSSNVQRHLDLAQLLMLRRDGAATIEWSKKALALDPDNKRAFALLGDGYARTGDRDAAIQAWLKSLGLNDAGPKQIEVIAQRAVHEADTSFNRGDVARAERFYRRAILSQPDNAVAAAGLAQALLLIGEPGPAAKWAERAVSIGPGEARAHVALGDVLAQKGDMAGAKSQWDEANTLDPGNRDIAKRLKKAARQLE
jgi:cytochrome c-type biogenesis protein CcmH/NrfG